MEEKCQPFPFGEATAKAEVGSGLPSQTRQRIGAFAALRVRRNQNSFGISGNSSGALDGKGIHKTGAIYRSNGREDNEVLTQKPALPAGQWNAYEIRVEGGKFTVTLNGDVVCVFDNPYPGRGEPSTAAVPTFIGLQAYPNPAWSVSFRKIRFQPI